MQNQPPRKKAKSKSYDYSNYIPPTPHYVEHTPLFNKKGPHTPFSHDNMYPRSKAPDMMANPNPRQSQPLSAADFMLLDPSLSQNDNVTRRPSRKAPVVKEMVNQMEENIRKNSPKPNLNDLKPLGTPNKKSKIPTPKQKRNRNKPDRYSPF
jgi:hypothetical protein